jgi:hypothetical protein
MPLGLARSRSPVDAPLDAGGGVVLLHRVGSPWGGSEALGKSALLPPNLGRSKARFRTFLAAVEAE